MFENSRNSDALRPVWTCSAARRLFDGVLKAKCFSLLVHYKIPAARQFRSLFICVCAGSVCRPRLMGQDYWSDHRTVFQLWFRAASSLYQFFSALWSLICICSWSEYTGFSATISVTESCLRETPQRFPQLLFNDFTQNRWILETSSKVSVCISVSTVNATNALYASDTGYIVSGDCELCLAGGGLLPCLRSEVTPAVCCSSRAAFSGLGLQVDQ